MSGQPSNHMRQAYQPALTRALADGEVLQFGGASAADGNPEFLGGLKRPLFSLRRNDMREGDLDAVGVDVPMAHPLDELGDELR